MIKSEPLHDKFFTNVGLLCGTCDGGTIENITIGTVDITVHRQSSRTGYICGKAENANICGIKANSGYMSGNGDMGAIVGAAFSSVIDKCDVKKFTNKYYAVGYSRSIGGIAGYTETTKIKNCSVRDSEFIFDDYDKNSITPETLEPALGDIVGNLLKSGSISGCINKNITNYTYYDKLKENYKYGGILGINPKTANQQKNIRHYDGGKVGKK